MLVEGSNRSVFGIDAHAGMAVTGYAADGRQIVNRAREEAQSYRDTYGHRIIPSILNNRLSLYMHYFTIYGSLRPFGATAILAAYDEDTKTPELYMMDPSGGAFRFHGCSAGKGTNAANTELEKILNRHGSDGITCKQAVMELGKMLVFVYFTSFFFTLFFEFIAEDEPLPLLPLLLVLHFSHFFAVQIAPDSRHKQGEASGAGDGLAV